MKGFPDGDPWKGRFESLSIGDKHFYNKYMPGILATAEISTVSKKSIPHIIERLKEYHPTTFNLIDSHSDGSRYIERFIGFKISRKTLTSSEYAKKMMRKSIGNIPKLTKAQIKDICPSAEALKKEIKDATGV